MAPETAPGALASAALHVDKTAEQRAALARLGFGRLFWTVRDGIVVADARTGVVAAWNPAAERIFGYAVGEIVGKPLDLLVPERLLGTYHALLARYAASGHGATGSFALPDATVAIEVQAARRDGTEITVEVTLSPVEGAGEGVPGRFVHASVRDVTERKRLEAALALEAERYRLLAEAAERAHREKRALLASTAEGIYGLDAQGRCTFANPAAAALLGYAVEDLLGQDMHALVHHHRADGSSYSRDECPIAAASRSGTPLGTDDEVLWRRDGTSFSAEYTACPVLEDGRVTGAVVAFRDVTERLRHQQAERERAHLLQTVIDSIPDGIFLKDLEGRYVLANEAGARIRGTTLEALLGRTAAEVHPPEVARSIAEHDRRVLEAGHPVTAEYAQITRDAQRSQDIQDEGAGGRQPLYWLSTKAPYRDSSGAVAGIVGIARDITERVRAEAALRESQERYERQYRHTPLPTFTWQRKGEDIVLIDGNAAADAITRGRLQQLMGATVEEFYRDRPLIRESFARCVREEQTVILEGDYRLQSTGEQKYLRVTLVFVPPDLVVVNVLDLTDHRAREEAERERSKLEGALLVSRTVAHEINNALAPIMGGADLLRMDSEVDRHPARSAYLAMIESAARDAATKVARLQSIVRLEAQPSPLGSDRPILDLDRSTTA